MVNIVVIPASKYCFHRRGPHTQPVNKMPTVARYWFLLKFIDSAQQRPVPILRNPV